MGKKVRVSEGKKNCLNSIRITPLNLRNLKGLEDYSRNKIRVLIQSSLIKAWLVFLNHHI